uniref:Arrestin_C domain-containing protein n=1 Tax=Caenorhabditis tropicalis TaxID=1561998 RepID=A0A1I7UHL6_9PELO
MIVFDAPSAIYTPGQTVTGKFLLPITKPTHIESVKLKIKGVTKTSWDRIGKVGVNYHMNDEVIITNDRKDYTVPGRYPIPFEFRLPSDLPPTFTCRNAHIYYEIKILVYKNADNYSDYIRKEFYVIQKLNNQQWNNLELALRNSHTFNAPVSSFFKECGSIKINLNCDQKILSPGKPAELFARITNDSTKTIEKISVKLLAMVKSFSPLSHSRNLTVHLLLEKQSLALEVLPGESKEQKCQIRIPANYVTTFDSQDIQVHHSLRVTVKFKEIFNRCISLRKPLVVGIHENDEQEYLPMEPHYYEEVDHKVDVLPTDTEAVNV